MRITTAMLIILALGACTAGARSTDEIGNIQANCSNVDSEIWTLEQEKIENDRRVAAGAGSIMPVTAVARLVMGRYETNTKIATGEWAQRVDAKLAELRNLQRHCLTQTSYHY